MRFVVVLVLVASASARADEVPTEARELFKKGLERSDARDYEGALAYYEQAFSRYPSPKILLNMGTSLKELGRHAEAAATYERYLADPGADPARRPEVERILAELDRKLARLHFDVAAGSRVSVNGKPIGESKGTTIVHRVEPGPHSVRVEKDGFEAAGVKVAVAAGEDRRIAVDLRRVAALDPEPPARAPARAQSRSDSEVAVEARAARPSRFGALVRADVDGKLRGGVLAVGGSVSFGMFELVGAGLIGENPGAYLGAGFCYPRWRVQPLLLAGAPIYVADGAQVGVHGAAGARLALLPSLSVSVLAGVEYFPSVPSQFETVVFVPSVEVRLSL